MTETPPLIRRVPALGVVLAAVLVLGAVTAFVMALSSDDGGSDLPPGARDGGFLRVGVVGQRGFDPAEARDPTAVMVADQLFDTLVTYDPGTLEPQSGLATFEADPTQTVFTFRIDPAATFHDGTPVSAADVKFTLERIAARDSPSPLVAQLESVAGFGAYHLDGDAEDLAGVETPEPRTVVVRLDEPLSTFPSILAHPGFGVVPRVAVRDRGAGFGEEPVGSGPFRMGEPAEGGTRLVRYGDHTRPARLDGIDLVAFDSTGDAYRAFRDGDLDVAPVPPEEVADATEEYGDTGREPYIGVVFYGMNVNSPDLADVRFRRAVALAVDRAGIVADVYRGSVEPATGLVAEGVPGRATDACGDRCAHDPDRARALLEEAFPDGDVPEVSVDHDDDPTQVAVAASIRADLETVGIPVTVRSHPLGEYGQFLVSGAQELFRLGWIADYPSPDGFLTPLFSSGSPENVTGLASVEVDAKLAEARATADPEARQALFREVEELVLDQFVVIPVAQLETRLVVAERVVGFDLDLLGSFDGAAVALVQA